MEGILLILIATQLLGEVLVIAVLLQLMDSNKITLGIKWLIKNNINSNNNKCQDNYNYNLQRMNKDINVIIAHSRSLTIHKLHLWVMVISNKLES